MYSQRIRSVMEKKLLAAAPQSTVYDAARLMTKRKVGAVLVVDAGRLVGIFTERDAVVRVLARKRDPHRTQLAEVMTPDPVAAGPDELFGHVLQVMHEKGFRHMPVVESGRPIGVVSARNALDPELEEFTIETHRRKSFRPQAKVA